VPEPPGPPVQSITAPPTNDQGGSSPPANEESITAPPANEGDGGSTPPANEGDGTNDGATGAGSVPFIPISPTNPSDNKEGNAIEQGAQAASAQTDTSNEDAFQNGVKDANRDLKGLNGHGFDGSCPKGHSAAFCDEYKQGYHESWYDTEDNQPRYDSQQPTKPIKAPQNPLHSGNGAGNGRPNINIDNRQQQKGIVKVNTKVNTKVDTATKNVIVNNIVTAPSQGKQPTFLLLLDTAQLCQLAGDIQCVAKQNQFTTLNLITKLDSTGKTWTITGQAKNIAAETKTQRNVQVTAYFYDSKGNNVGGGSSYQGAVNPSVLKSLQSGAFNFKASTSVMKGTPSFLRVEYETTA
jgi:hypothetical protein